MERKVFPWRWSALFYLLLFGLLGACSGDQVSYEPVPSGATVLAFGDSVTYGVGANAATNYPTRLAQMTGWQVINAGISGDTAQKAQHRIAALLDKHTPALVIVELGGNDFLRKRQPSKVKADLLNILEQCKANGVATVLVSVPALSILRATMGSLSDAEIYAELAEEAGVGLIPDVFSSVLSDDDLLADRIHPNAEGYRVFTEGVVQRLRELGLLL